MLIRSLTEAAVRLLFRHGNAFTLALFVGSSARSGRVVAGIHYLTEIANRQLRI